MVALLAGAVFRTVRAENRLYRPSGASNEIEHEDRTLYDESRDRRIPVRVFRPGTRVGGQPVVVFSPGLGASRTDYGYLAEHLARHGYFSIVLTHPGSDAASRRRWLQDNAPGSQERRRGWVLSSIEDPENLKNRPLDVSFVIDRLAAGDIAAGADASLVGVAGHSFGASTAMAVGGMLVDLPQADGGPGTSFRDPRVKAVLAMSPQGPGTMGIGEESWSAFAVPVMLMTGTRDRAPGIRTVAWRKAALDRIQGVDRYALTLRGGTHLTFGGRGTGETFRDRVPFGLTSRAHHVKVIESAALAFFDSYLTGSIGARRWLGGYFGGDQPDATVDFRSGRGN